MSFIRASAARIVLASSWFCFGLPTAEAFQRELPGAAASLADEISLGKIRSLAVVDFTDLQGNVTELGRFIAEEMALGLVIAKKQLSVVDRTHLRALLQEHKLASTGVINPATARRLGEIAGVEALVTGTITPLGDSVRLVVKVLDTNTARILAASSVEIAKTKTIEELMARDIRANSYSPPTGASTQESLSPTPFQKPVFQNDSIRVTAGEIGVTAYNNHASLSAIVENISRDPVYLAIQGGGTENNTTAIASLSDDRGSSFSLDSLSGLEVLIIRSSSKYGDTIRSSDNFTSIAPGGRAVMVMHFHGPSNNQPGSVFSFSAQGVRFSPSGVSRFSIGLTGIKGTILKK